MFKGFRRWLFRWLDVDNRLQAVEQRPSYTLTEVVQELKEYGFLIIAGDHQVLADNHVIVPPGKGVVLLGTNNLIQGLSIDEQLIRASVEEE